MTHKQTIKLKDVIHVRAIETIFDVNQPLEVKTTEEEHMQAQRDEWLFSLTPCQRAHTAKQA